MAKRNKTKKTTEPLDPVLRVDDFKIRNANPSAIKIVSGDEQISDVEGNIGNPLRVVDSLEHLHRRKKISDEHYDAGQKFSRDFAAASLVGIRSVDFLGVHGGNSHGLADSTYQARDRVWRAYSALGSLGGEAAWHVLGLGETCAEWGKGSQQANGRSLHPQEATGVLRGALSNLADFYGLA